MAQIFLSCSRALKEGSLERIADRLQKQAEVCLHQIVDVSASLCVRMGIRVDVEIDGPGWDDPEPLRTLLAQTVISELEYTGDTGIDPIDVEISSSLTSTVLDGDTDEIEIRKGESPTEGGE